jgi:hypothetical protein
MMIERNEHVGEAKRLDLGGYAQVKTGDSISCTSLSI